MGIKFLIYLLGPPFVRPATAGMTSESFVGTDSLRDRLGRSLITTTAPSIAGEKRYFYLLQQRCLLQVNYSGTSIQPSPLYNERYFSPQ